MQCRRQTPAGAGGLVDASKAETGGLIIRTARERGITAPIVAWPAVGGIEKVAGQTANGVITQAAIDPDSDEGNNLVNF